MGFGEVLRLSGPAAKENPFRFSTKRANDTTDLVLYEYRVFLPSTERWLSRDPIGEQGGMALYGFVENATISEFDVWGLSITCDGCSLECLGRFLGALAEGAAQALITDIKNRGCSEPDYLLTCCPKWVGVKGSYSATYDRVTFCCNMADRFTLDHELRHAQRACMGGNMKDCEHRICSEIVAHY